MRDRAAPRTRCGAVAVGGLIRAGAEDDELNVPEAPALVVARDRLHSIHRMHSCVGEGDEPALDRCGHRAQQGRDLALQGRTFMTVSKSWPTQSIMERLKLSNGRSP